VPAGPVAAAATAQDRDDQQQDHHGRDDDGHQHPARCAGFGIGTGVRQCFSFIDTSCLYQTQNVYATVVTYN
jgi:hypothetical protein